MNEKLYYWDLNYPIPYPIGGRKTSHYYPIKIVARTVNQFLKLCENEYDLIVDQIQEIRQYEVVNLRGYTVSQFKVVRVFRDEDLKQVKRTYKSFHKNK